MPWRRIFYADAVLTEVAVTADPHDGRSVRVTLTESAHHLVPRITAAIGDCMAPLTGPLSTDEQTRLTALLTKAVGLENP
jgi:DNA-binding MarR family transcriptional regulator